MWLALALIVLLIVMSIAGAFVGSQSAKRFFNTLPLSFYWLIFTMVLVWAIAAFRRLFAQPGLLLIHSGCIFILLGGLWGSSVSHFIRSKVFGVNKVPSGYMVIYEGSAENRIVSENEEVLTELPFSIFLKDFRIDYYSTPDRLLIETRSGQKYKIASQPEEKIVLPQIGAVKITRVFGNFKIKIDGQEKTASNLPGPHKNPAVEIEITDPNDSRRTRYVFAKFPDMAFDNDGLRFTYESSPAGGVKDYYSELVVLENGDSKVEKLLEVNHPLNYGGYNFYQHSYDSRHGRYTILSVASDSGLGFVYGGYIFLMAGLLWHFWVKNIFLRKN